MSFLAFCSLSYVRAAMHRITSLELLGTLIAGLEQKSKLIDLRPTCWKSSFSVSEAWLMRVREVAYFSWN